MKRIVTVTQNLGEYEKMSKADAESILKNADFKILMKKGNGERKCRICECTDDNCSQCVEKTGVPCYWVSEDLCSACANEGAQKVEKR